MMDQKKIGLAITYTNLALNTFINLFLTPYLISSLGDDSYSIYKVMQSFAGPLIMFNLGISTIVARAIVKYETLEEYNLKEKQNTIAIAMLTSIAMAILVTLIGLVMLLCIPSLYGSNYSDSLIHDGQIIFILFVLSTILHILTDSFNGCAIGHEKYAFNSSLAMVKNILRAGLIIIALKCGCGAIGVTAADCIVALVVFALAMGYGMFKLKEIPKLTYIDKTELLNTLSFSAAILLQAIINQVNNNVDNIVLGANIHEKRLITMYSSALMIYGVYNSIVFVASTFFLPKATRLTTNKADGEELTDFVIKPGRFQAMVAMAIIVGFCVLGKEFFSIWIGEQYSDAYYVVLILIIPATIPLVESTALSILDATLKRMYRSITLVAMAAVNVVVSIILVHYISFWGAAIGTCFSLLIGDGYLMNSYYANEFGMKIGRMFRSIFRGVLPMSILAGIICIPLTIWNSLNVFVFLFKGLVFSFVYFILVWKWGMIETERQYILDTFHRKKTNTRNN